VSVYLVRFMSIFTFEVCIVCKDNKYINKLVCPLSSSIQQ